MPPRVGSCTEASDPRSRRSASSRCCSRARASMRWCRCRSSERRRELAVRVALGAGRGRIVRSVLSQTGWQLLAGTAAGLLLATAVMRGVELLPFDLDKSDPSLVALTVATLAGAGLAACLQPLRQALTLRPVDWLRGRLPFTARIPLEAPRCQHKCEPGRTGIVVLGRRSTSVRRLNGARAGRGLDEGVRESVEARGAHSVGWYVGRRRGGSRLRVWELQNGRYAERRRNRGT